MKHKPKNTETDPNLRKALMKILLDLNIDLPEKESSRTLLSLMEHDDENMEVSVYNSNNNKQGNFQNPEKNNRS